MTAAHVLGVAVWTTDSGKPTASILPAMLRRRTSLLTRMVAEVVAALGETSGADLSAVPLVLGSCFGEIDTTISLLRMMHEHDGALSPTKFHNSVHNTALGYVSIATGNRGFATALAGGRGSVAAALIEGLGVLASGSSEVLIVAADEAVPDPFTPAQGHGGLAVALHLAADPGRATLPSLSSVRRGGTPPAPRSDAFAHNPCAPALDLAVACQGDERKMVCVDPNGLGWSVEVIPGATR